MSNTTISPGVGAFTAAGVAAALGLTISPIGAGLVLAGIAAVVAAASSIAPAHEGQPYSASGLAAGATGTTTPSLLVRQARFTVSGVWGTNASLVLQGSTSGVVWSNLAAIADPVVAGVSLATAPGCKVLTQPNGVVLVAQTDLSAAPVRFLRPLVQGGDATTSLNVSGNLSASGCV